MKILVKVEYHGQIWFKVEDAPEDLIRRSKEHSRRYGRQAVSQRHPSEDRGVDDYILQSSGRLSSLG